MEAMLLELRKRFKFVVIDSPPVLPVTDAMILSTFVDGVVFVIGSGTTVRGAVTRSCKILQNVGAKVLGIVLNKVDLRHGEYYGSYGHYYYNYHSDEKEPTPSSKVISSPPPTQGGELRA
jgi:Mrp family chromosome partitioning ATPase